VAEMLFKKYPFKDEGFLTDIRSRIVNREALNNVAKKMGLNQIVQFDANKKTSISHKSLYGDALEALVGAVYLDRDFKICRHFILQKIILPHFDLEMIIQENPNYKSKIIEWSQKENKELRFEIIEIKEEKFYKEFTAQVYLEGEALAIGKGLNKKKAEQEAAQKSLQQLKLE